MSDTFPDYTSGNTPDPSEKVVIGEVVGAHGVRGELKIYPRTDFPERLQELKGVTLRTPGGGERYHKVIRSRPHKNVFIMQLSNINSVEEVDALRGAQIVVPREARYALPDEDTFYVDDLVGLRVQTEDGEVIGTIKEVLKYPANDVYDLGNNLLIPAVRDVVLNVDLDARIMTIRPIPGLLDEPEVV